MNDDKFDEMNREAMNTTKMVGWCMIIAIGTVIGIAVLFLINH